MRVSRTRLNAGTDNGLGTGHKINSFEGMGMKMKYGEFKEALAWGKDENQGRRSGEILMTATVELVVVAVKRGGDRDSNPLRVVRQIWTPEGEFIAEYDPLGLCD